MPGHRLSLNLNLDIFTLVTEKARDDLVLLKVGGDTSPMYPTPLHDNIQDCDILSFQSQNRQKLDIKCWEATFG